MAPDDEPVTGWRAIAWFLVFLTAVVGVWVLVMKFIFWLLDKRWNL